MESFGHETLLKPRRFGAKPVLIWAMLILIGGFVTFTALRGISESWNNDAFPEALGVKLVLLPLIFPLHMVAGGLALLLVPLALLTQGTRLHRALGRVAALDIVVAGVTAFPVALQAPVTRVSAAGFSAQGFIWLALLGFGWWSIRRGQRRQHRAAMLLLAAVTSGALFFRIYLGLWKLVGSMAGFYSFYAFDAWIAWGLPLLVMALLLRANSLPRALQ